MEKRVSEGFLGRALEDGILAKLDQCEDGKAGGMRQLGRLGFSSPPSWIVPAKLFDDMLAPVGIEASPTLYTLDTTPGMLDCARSCLANDPLPEHLLETIEDVWAGWKAEGFPCCRLIVRSSATVEDGSRHSYAGVFASVVVDQPGDLPEAIRAVWASVLAPRAMAYYRLSGLDRLPSMALLIQPFLEADRSGVMFTRFTSPDGGEARLIEHVAGDCEQLVSGAVTPERLWLPLEGGGDVPMAGEDGLTERHIQALDAAAVVLEGALGGPQDVEWCVVGDQLFFLQTRPITAMGGPVSAPAEPSDQPVLLRGVAASPGQAAGPVHLVFNITDADQLEPGSVLVTPMTNPDMVPAMRNAAGVVTDVGGMICHAAIVSRELGIPCVVGTEHASRDLAAGLLVSVDGSRGRVLAGGHPLGEIGQPESSLSWPGLWQDWRERAPAGAVPLLAGADGLDFLPADLTECLLDPAIDLELDDTLLPRDDAAGRLNPPDAELGVYLARVAALAARWGVQVGLLSVPRLVDQEALPRALAGFPELFFLVPAGTVEGGVEIFQGPTGMRYALANLPDLGVCGTAGRQGRLVLPLAAVSLAGRSPDASVRDDGDRQSGVFGRMPGMRLAPMPAQARRAPTHALLPALAAVHQAAPAPAAQEYEWLDLRPEVVISPMLKSLVAPGMELIPSALGFSGQPPLYVKWIQCRMHFRKDSFFPVWMRLREATWERPFLADMLARTRESYRQLALQAARFPRDAAAWQNAPAAQLADLFVDWWRAFADFFSLSFFIQAQGDDCVYPWVAERLKGLAATLPGLPGLADLTAPATPVLTADYLADLGRLRGVLEASGARDVQAGLVLLESDPAGEVAGIFRAFRERWGWMRERDPFFPPYDTAGLILEKALKTQPAPPPDYPGNARRARLALAALTNLAASQADRERMIYAVGYGHSLVMERENHHVVWLRESYPFRALCLEWERRLAQVCAWQQGDIFFLEAPEALALVAALPSAPAPQVLARLRNRRAAYERETRLRTDGEAPLPEDDYI